MDSKVKLFLLLIAGVAVALGVIMLRGREPVPVSVEEQAAPAGVQILVTKRDVAAGEFVQPTDLEWKNIAPEEARDDYLKQGPASPEQYSGAVARHYLRTGMPLTQASMLRAGEGGFLSAVLAPGLRAMSISVNPISGNAGFVSPGDKVDLVLTHRIPASSEGGIETIVSETFIENIRVLAVDQQVENPENKPILARTVTVEVTPTQVQLVSVATEMGKVSLSLRSVAMWQEEESESGMQAADEGASEVTTVEQGQSMAAQKAVEPTVVELYKEYSRETDVSHALGKDIAIAPIKVIRADRVDLVEAN